jgi:DNA-binding CsgD family transcriptional regulator/pimeloyl-ACP methyl ester carboxylesterase
MLGNGRSVEGALADTVRFCTSADGTQLGYLTFGNGRPLLIVPAWWMSPDADRRRIIGRDFWSHLPPGHRVFTYDLRGIGASSREVADVSIERQVEDLGAVAEQFRSSSFDLLCYQDGIAAGATFAARHPERVRRIVLYNPCAYVPAIIGRRHIAVWGGLIEADWGLASRCFAQLLYPKGPIEAQEASTKAIRETQTPEVAGMYLEYVNSFDVRDTIKRLEVPTLVISREGPGKTPLVPRATVQDVAREIRGCQFVSYDVAAAVCPYFDHRTYLPAVREFLGEDAPTTQPHPTLTAREIEVIKLVARGRTNGQIAEELVISRNTADRHVSNILAKVAAANRAEAVLYAARTGLLD